MFPKTYTDKTQCLESLVGIRSQCEVDTDYPFWIEDIPGLDIKKLANTASPSHLKGKDLGQWLINSAAREMLADIELLLNNGYRMNSVVGSVCSTCSFIPTYLADSGIKIKAIHSSRYQKIRITELKVAANVTNDVVIILDDGVTQTEKEIAVSAGSIMPIKLNYETKEREVSIYFQDDTIGAAKIVCSTSSTCGCSGTSNGTGPVVVSGLVGGVDSSTQYGFLPCVTVECSNETMVCNLINSAPNIFGLTLLLKIGEKYVKTDVNSERNNESISFNGEDKKETKNEFAKAYRVNLQGTKDQTGVKQFINNFLKTERLDHCVICDAKVFTAYAIG